MSNNLREIKKLTKQDIRKEIKREKVKYKEGRLESNIALILVIIAVILLFLA